MPALAHDSGSELSSLGVSVDIAPLDPLLPALGQNAAPTGLPRWH